MIPKDAINFKVETIIFTNCFQMENSLKKFLDFENTFLLFLKSSWKLENLKDSLKGHIRDINMYELKNLY